MSSLQMFGRSVWMTRCEASYVLRSHSLSSHSLSTYCNKMQNNCIIQITTPPASLVGLERTSLLLVYFKLQHLCLAAEALKYIVRKNFLLPKCTCPCIINKHNYCRQPWTSYWFNVVIIKRKNIKV